MHTTIREENNLEKAIDCLEKRKDMTLGSRAVQSFILITKH